MSLRDQVDMQLRQGFDIGRIGQNLRIRRDYAAYDAEIARLRKALDDKDAFYKDLILNQWRPQLDAARAELKRLIADMNILWARAVLFRRQRNAWYKVLKQVRPELPEATIRKLARDYRDQEIASMREKWKTNTGLPSLEAELKSNENTSNPDDPAAV